MTSARLRKGLIDLRTSFWFTPSACVVVCSVLGWLMVNVRTGDFLENWLGGRLLLGAPVEVARELLTAVATSMITIAGVTFSITIVVLSLASSQYSPRILRNFMRDRGNQLVLGVFLGAFSYCLVVLGSLKDTNGEMQVPTVALAVCMILALVAVGFFIFFIHHIATAVQVEHVLKCIARETIKVMEAQWPEVDGGALVGPEIDELRWNPIPIRLEGYVTTIDYHALAKVATKHETVLRLHVAPGDFIARGSVLASASLHDAKHLGREVARHVSCDASRTIEQDPAFGIRQILDIALKALSPGVNEVHTAVEAVDHLTNIFVIGASRGEPRCFYFDKERLRVIASERDFGELFDYAYRSIRNSGGGHVSLFERVLSSLRLVGEAAKDQARRERIAAQCRAVAETIEQTVHLVRDRQPLVEEAMRLAVELEDESCPDTAPAAEKREKPNEIMR